MRPSLIRIGLLLCLTGAGTASGQNPIADVLVTGQVTKVTLCSHASDAWIYRFVIRMQAKNMGTRPVVISSASAQADYYKVATSLDQLNTQQYSHIGWVTSGVVKDPKSVPKQLVAPFKAVAPKGGVDIDVDFRAIIIGELQPGPSYIQVVAENLPAYSKLNVVPFPSRNLCDRPNLWMFNFISRSFHTVSEADGFVRYLWFGSSWVR